MSAQRLTGLAVVLLALACSREEATDANPSGAAGATAGAAAALGPASPNDAGAGVAGASSPPTAAGSGARPSIAGATAGGGGGNGGSSGNAGSSGAAAGSSGSASPPMAAAGNGGAMGAPADAGMPTPDAGFPAAMLGPDCDEDPLASEQPFGRGFYQEFVGLYGCTAPADLALYREMLPVKFEMPSNPQVCFYINDFKISSVGPYHEVAILLPITYAGMDGKYVLSMVLDNQAATSGGRAVGFPKYIGEVSLTQEGHNWVGTARAGGQVDFQVTYTGECRSEDVFPWPDFINLTPIPSGTPSNEAFLSPRTGSAVMVPAEYLVDPAYYSLKGSVKLQFADDLPWNGLVDETKAFPGHLVSFKGGINLGNRRLD